MEHVGSGIRGIYRDLLRDEYGQLLHDSGWNSNKIVIGCRKLISGYMKNDPSIGIQGVQHLAVGYGQESWDAGTIPPPLESTFQLENKAVDDEVKIKVNPSDTTFLTMTYLDSNDIETDAVSDRLQITAVLGLNYPEPTTEERTYPLREFGLFGEYNDEIFMINCIRHPVIHKGPTATLERIVQLHF